MNREDQLRTAILNALKNVSRANSPNIYNLMHDKKGKVIPRGYQVIETKIIKKVINDRISISAAIPQLEMEMELR